MEEGMFGLEPRRGARHGSVLGKSGAFELVAHTSFLPEYGCPRYQSCYGSSISYRRYKADQSSSVALPAISQCVATRTRANS